MKSRIATPGISRTWVFSVGSPDIYRVSAQAQGRPSQGPCRTASIGKDTVGVVEVDCAANEALRARPTRLHPLRPGDAVRRGGSSGPRADLPGDHPRSAGGGTPQ